LLTYFFVPLSDRSLRFCTGDKNNKIAANDPLLPERRAFAAQKDTPALAAPYGQQNRGFSATRNLLHRNETCNMKSAKKRHFSKEIAKKCK
jgi:hypothetical protein